MSGQNTIILKELSDEVINAMGGGGSDTSDIHCIGDSITAGVVPATPYPEQLATKTGRTVVNSGIAGYTVENIVKSQILKTVGSFEFNFRDTSYLWNESNSGISIDNDRMVLEHVGLSSPRAIMQLDTEIGEEYTVSGIMAGDGTSWPTFVDNGFGSRWTGTTSTSKQTFSTTFTAASAIMRIDCAGGTTGNKVYVHGLKIEKTDKSNVAPNDIMFTGGLNDVGGAIPFATTIEGYKVIRDACYQNNKRLIFILVTPWNSTPANMQLVFALNDWIVKNIDTPIIDPTSLGDSDYNQTFNTLDGLHFDTTGNGLFADLIIEQVYTSGYSGNTYRPRVDSSNEGTLKRVDNGVWQVPVDDVEYYNGFKDGSQAYYQQHTVEIGSGGTTTINASFYSDGFNLSSYRFWAVEDATPTNKYAIPKVGSAPTFEVPEVTAGGLSITRAGSGVYPGWSYVGGYTYFK